MRSIRCSKGMSPPMKMTPEATVSQLAAAGPSIRYYGCYCDHAMSLTVTQIRDSTEAWNQIATDSPDCNAHYFLGWDCEGVGYVAWSCDCVDEDCVDLG
ncbi:hypothetical protein PsorP6_016692 [Peronosclerospora sorghi]|uniref:Uncharacterized protein n=1 Tax=Peronosclerospora sorghi TaxID=230839 RepID=A0ACC0VJZ8_9STRA|nr:hypothetical protein PsorP6_016692 [Peronosclerospora sorghi]